MEISKKQGLIVIAVLFLGGAAVGRFTLPAKIVTKTETKVVEKEVVKWKERKSTEKQNNKNIVMIEIISPDGTIRKEKHIVDRGTVKIIQDKEGEKIKEVEIVKNTETTKEYSKNDWILSAMVTPSYDGSLLSSHLSYGGMAQRRIIGPFYLGLWGMTNKNVGASVGVSF